MLFPMRQNCHLAVNMNVRQLAESLDANGQCRVGLIQGETHQKIGKECWLNFGYVMKIFIVKIVQYGWAISLGNPSRRLNISVN
jgi:hypothetical protein